MHAYGTDRLRLAGEKLILWSRVPKPKWVPRVPKTLTRAEHPGTAVLWDDQFFEVVAAVQLPTGAVEYTLEPWKDTHMIRTSDRYDEGAEEERVAEHRKNLKREKQRKATFLLSMVAGHLPTGVQNQLGSELGVNPARMTITSTLFEWAAFATCVYLYVDAILKKEPNPVPIAIWLIVGFGMLDAAIRGFVYFSQSRPMGSPFGFVAYVIYYYVLARDRAKLLSPFEDEKGWRTPVSTPPDDIALRDSIETWGPFLSLLTPAEQNRLAAIGFDYRRHAPGLAWILLVFSAAGAISSLMRMVEQKSALALVSAVIAGAVALEQIVRLSAFPKRPAGSILGVAARPFVRRLLEKA